METTIHHVRLLTFECAKRFLPGFPLAQLSGEVFLGDWIVSSLSDGDGINDAVELPITMTT